MATLCEHLIIDGETATVADFSGNGRHLTVTAPEGEAAFGDDAQGRHFSVVAGNRTSLAKLQSAPFDQLGQAAAFNGLQKFTIALVVGAQLNGDASGSYYWHLGAIGGPQDGIVSIRKWSTGPWQVQFNGDSGRYVRFWSGDANVIVVDTTQAVREDRVKCYRVPFGASGVPVQLTPVLSSSEVVQNWAISIADPANTHLTLMNAVSGALNAQGNCGYHQFIDRALSESEVFALLNALKVDHDTTLIPAAPVPDLAGSAVINIGTTTATARAVSTVDEGNIYAFGSTSAVEENSLIESSGATQEADGSEFYDFPLSGLTLDSDYYVHILHVAPGGTTKIVIPYSTLAEYAETSTVTIGVPAGYNMVTVGDNPYLPATQTLQKRPRPGWQMFAQNSHGQWTDRATFHGDHVGVFDVWIYDPFDGYISRVIYDNTGLSGAIRPNTPDLLPNVLNANPGSQHQRTFQIQGVPAATPVTWYAQDGATLQLNGGAAAGQVTGELGDTVTVNGYASEQFGEVLNPGVIGPGGVSASFQITTRAAAAPYVPPLTGPSAVSVGTAATIESDVTGATSIRWEVNGEEVVGANSEPLVFTPPAIGTYSIVLIAESAEGGVTQSAPFVLNAIAVATRVMIPQLRDRATGQLRGGEQNVPLYVLSDNRSQRLVPAATINLAASGVTPFVNNALGAAGTWVRVGFPAANGNTAVEIRLQVEA